jgi:hypothetical protein
MSGVVVALLGAALAGAAGNSVVEMGTRVTGNQEQPKVLYIVPWQPPDGPQSLYQDIGSRIDDLYAPVARETFQRELSLREQFEQLRKDTATP